MKCKWNGHGAIHTPSGVVEHGEEFEATPQWIATHPRWFKIGLVTKVEKKSPKK